MGRRYSLFPHESEGGCLSTPATRNERSGQKPTLLRNSAQYLPITKVKKDVLDNTTSLSRLVLSGFNADFDGDSLNGQVLLCNKLARKAAMLRPHFAIHSFLSPGDLNNTTSMSPVTVSIWAGYLNR